MTSWPCLLVLFPFVIPSIWLRAGPVTCFCQQTMSKLMWCHSWDYITSNSIVQTDLMLYSSHAGFKCASCHVVRSPIEIVWQGNIRALGDMVISTTASSWGNSEWRENWGSHPSNSKKQNLSISWASLENDPLSWWQLWLYFSQGSS